MSSGFVPVNLISPKFLAFALSLLLLRVCNSKILPSLSFLCLLFEVFVVELSLFLVLVEFGGSKGGVSCGPSGGSGGGVSSGLSGGSGGGVLDWVYAV